MRRIFQHLFFFAVVGSWTLGALLAATPSNKGPNRLDHEMPEEKLPIRIYGGFLVVAEGQFGASLQHQNFILDTGTSPSILNARVAKHLGLRLSPAKVGVIGRDFEVAAATVPEVQLGPLHAEAAPFFVSDLAGVERILKVPIAGILGLDILGRSSFRLDYEKQILEFGDINEEGIPIALTTSLQLPIAEVTIRGKTLHLLVDTGSNRMVVFGKARGTDFSETASGESLAGGGVAGSVPVRALSSIEFEWHGERFQQKAVFAADREEPLFDGLMGVRSMGFRSIAVDANTHVIYLRK